MKIAEAAGISKGQDEDPFAHARQLLSKTVARELILILDGVDNHAALGETFTLEPFVRESTKVIIILSTKDKSVGFRFLDQAEGLIKVPAFTMHESAQLLKDKIGSDYAEADYERLAQTMCHIPLALTQAAAYIMELDTTPSKYLTLYHKNDFNEMAFLSEDFGEEMERHSNRNPIATTFSLSVDEIHVSCPPAYRILARMGVLDAKAIPEALLRSEEDDVEFAYAIGRLRAFSLVAVTSIPGSEGEGYNVHQLVHFMMPRWLKHRNELGSTLNASAKRMTSLWFSLPTGELRFIWALLHDIHIRSFVRIYEELYKPGCSADENPYPLLASFVRMVRRQMCLVVQCVTLFLLKRSKEAEPYMRELSTWSMLFSGPTELSSTLLQEYKGNPSIPSPPPPSHKRSNIVREEKSTNLCAPPSGNTIETREKLPGAPPSRSHGGPRKSGSQKKAVQSQEIPRPFVPTQACQQPIGISALPPRRPKPPVRPRTKNTERE